MCVECPDDEDGRRSFQDMSGRALNNGPFQEVHRYRERRSRNQFDTVYSLFEGIIINPAFNGKPALMGAEWWQEKGEAGLLKTAK